MCEYIPRTATSFSPVLVLVSSLVCRHCFHVGFCDLVVFTEFVSLTVLMSHTTEPKAPGSLIVHIVYVLYVLLFVLLFLSCCFVLLDDQSALPASAFSFVVISSLGVIGLLFACFSVSSLSLRLSNSLFLFVQYAPVSLCLLPFFSRVPSAVFASMYTTTGFVVLSFCFLFPRAFLALSFFTPSFLSLAFSFALCVSQCLLAHVLQVLPARLHECTGKALYTHTHTSRKPSFKIPGI